MCMFASLRTYRRASIFVTVCVYIYLRVYMQVLVSAWLRACECVRMCKRMCLSVRAYACTCVFIGAFVDRVSCVPIKRVHAGVRIYTCMCMCACVRVHVHNMC